LNAFNCFSLVGHFCTIRNSFFLERKIFNFVQKSFVQTYIQWYKNSKHVSSLIMPETLHPLFKHLQNLISPSVSISQVFFHLTSYCCLLIIAFVTLGPHRCEFESNQGVLIISCEKAVQLIYGTSVVLSGARSCLQ
jgi:hypothetical protein